MDYFLRSVTNKAKWQEDAEGLHPDALSHINTKEKTLSFYKCDIDNKEEIKLILTALALGRDNIQKIDYIIVPSNIVYELSCGISVKKVSGKTILDCINDLHIDLIFNNAESLYSFANAFKRFVDTHQAPSSDVLGRLSDTELMHEIVTSIKSGKIQKDKLSGKKFYEDVIELLNGGGDSAGGIAP